MSEIDLHSIEPLAQAIRRKEISPCEVIATSLERIDALNPKLNAFLTVCADSAVASAKHAESKLMGYEELPPLLGIPIGIKDSEVTRGIRTTFGSRAYKDYIPDVNTIHVERLLAAGAIVVGKTNTPEFTLLGETYNDLAPDCRNPWDLSRTVGGSSGGSGAAVASGIVPFASGTDTAGSITIPAAFCGTFGMKPSHRRIPIWPNSNEWPSFYDVGPITNSVRDAAKILSICSGHSARDPHSLNEPAFDFLASLDSPPSQMRIAWTRSLANLPVDAMSQYAVERIATVFERMGHVVEEVCPEVPAAGPISEVLGGVDEFKQRRRLLEANPELLERSTIEFIKYGEQSIGKAYEKASGQRQEVIAKFTEFFHDWDILLAPATACSAFPVRRPPEFIDGRVVSSNWTGYSPFNMYANLTGQPVANVPAGIGVDGLPLGVLIFGRYGEDDRVLRVSKLVEDRQPWQSPNKLEL